MNNPSPFDLPPGGGVDFAKETGVALRKGEFEKAVETGVEVGASFIPIGGAAGVVIRHGDEIVRAGRALSKHRKEILKNCMLAASLCITTVGSDGLQ